MYSTSWRETNERNPASLGSSYSHGEPEEHHQRAVLRGNEEYRGCLENKSWNNLQRR